MSAPHDSSPEGQKKRVAIDLDPNRHTQMTWISQLRGNGIAQEVMNAVDAHLEAAKRDPALQAKADQLRAEMEREVQAKQAALANLFATSEPPTADDGEQPTNRPKSRRTVKADEGADEA
ncbi:hypothetical protein [Nocardia sp. CA-119907]|uniref:hypothetical protein n=1 Tax=Nocardia sp. CA-119907 TaxID=3239973 RepID=UPI003D982137